MMRQTLGFIAALSLLRLLSSAQQASDKPWRFAVSGDSRNELGESGAATRLFILVDGRNQEPLSCEQN
jgi:hypothetical protein